MTKPSPFAAALFGIAATAASLPLDVKTEICGDCSVATAYVALAKPAKPPTPKPGVPGERDASVAPAQPAVIELPDDGHEWQLIYVFNERRYTDPKQRKLSAWCASDPRLRQLSAQTRQYLYNPTTPGFADYKSRGPIPQVWLVRDDSALAYQVTGDNLPETADELVASIVDGLKRIKPPAKPTTNVPPATTAPGKQPDSPKAIDKPTATQAAKPAEPANIPSPQPQGAIQRTPTQLYRTR